YRYDRVGPDTKVYGVIGDPIAHSLSPLIHNAAFAALDVDAVYVPFRVPTDPLPDFLRTFEKLPGSGCSVTIRHKEAAALVATAGDKAVGRTRGANTLVQIPGGFDASNPDYHATIETLKALLQPMSASEIKPPSSPHLVVPPTP